MRKIILLVFLAFFFLQGCSSKKEEFFLIKGDDAGYFIFNDFLKEFNFTQKDSEFNFVGGGVQPAINALVDKSCEIVFSLKKLNNEDLALMKSKNITPVMIPLFSVPVLIIGNASLPIDKINQDEVKKIFSGLYRYWWQLAKNKKDKDAFAVLGPIDGYSIDQRNGENHFLREKLVIGDFHQDIKNFGHPSALLEAVARDNVSIGYLSVPFFTSKVEKLKILFSEPEFDATAYLITDRAISENTSFKNMLSALKAYLVRHNSQFIQKGIKIIE